MNRKVLLVLLILAAPIVALTAVFALTTSSAHATAASSGAWHLLVRATATPVPTCPAAWSMARSPLTWGYANSLNGVSVVSANDAWAVGSYNHFGYDYQTLALRWDGSQWHVVSSPNAGQDSQLSAVDTISAGDAWAVGWSNSGTLTEHWDGAQWNIVPSPNPTSTLGWYQLFGVAAVSTNDLWAVGWAVGYSGSDGHSLIEHWNGAQWSVVPNPGSGQLNAVAAVAANDVWAVGSDNTGSSNDRTITMHWDGATWNVVPSPNIGPAPDRLYSVAAISANDVWAVGEDWNNGLGLVLHWDGTEWSIVPTPSQGIGVTLRGVTAFASNDVWAVGGYLVSQNMAETLTMHWDGSSWAIVNSPNADSSSQYLTSVAGGSSDNLLAVGYHNVGYNLMTFLYSNACPTPTVTPTPIGTITPVCAPLWNIVNSPSIAGWDNALFGVAAVSPSDIWAVGEHTSSGNGNQTLSMHWDGAQWTIVPSPNIGDNNTLAGVTSVSSNDVWAVGQSDTTGQALILHWDGTQWMIVPTPVVQSRSNLTSVVALSANNLWAVGSYAPPGGLEWTLIMHWNGMQWSVVPSPNVGLASSLHGITQVGASDIWAVGYWFDPSNTDRTLAMHWNGQAWSVVSTPNYTTNTDNELYGIAAITSADVWAVGQYNGAIGYYPEGPLMLHWDGAQWSIVPGEAGGIPAQLRGVTAISSRDVWAVGAYSSSNNSVAPLLMHWDGDGWMAAQAPSLAAHEQSIYAVAKSSDGLWGVGTHNPFGQARSTETLRYANPCGTPIPALTGHLTWQGRPAQPNARQQAPVTLTLRSGDSEINYPVQTTDASGYFTVSVEGVPAGTYSWRVKGPKYLANAGQVTLTGGQSDNVEMGLMRAGDCNGDNIVNLLDFIVMKPTFGKGVGDAGYDDRADFTGDSRVDVMDFNLLKNNFGQSGAPPVMPR